MITGFVVMAPEPADAWKPPTHLYGVWAAVQDLLDDGALEFETSDGASYTARANPVIAEALKSDLPAFYAGAIGPDAYPDMLFGQGLIHPDTITHNGDSPGLESSPPPKTSQSYMWADHLWNAAWASYEIAQTPQARSSALTNIAFALGYAAGHYNGDVWAHTWVNSFAGGVFPDFTDLSNADISIRHVIIEGYTDKHRPGFESDGGFGIDAPEQFIADQLIFSDFARDHADPILVIGMFGKIGERLENRIARFEYDIRTQDCIKLSKEGERCVEEEIPGTDGETGLVCKKAPCAPDPRDAPIDLIELASLEIRLEYSKAWLKDIHTGLEDWVAIWDDIARETFAGQKPDFKVVKEHIKKWVFKHFLSMLGLPDFVGGGIYAGIKAIGSLVGLWNSVMDWLWDQVELIPGIGDLVRWVREQIAIGIDKLKDQLLELTDRIAGLVVTGALGIACPATKSGEENGFVQDSRRSCLSDEVFAAMDRDRNGILKPSEIFRVFEEPEEYIEDPILFPPGTRAMVDEAMGLPDKCADFDGGETSREQFCDYDPAKFGPLSNTTTLAKLAMLDETGLNQLVRDMADDQSLADLYQPVLDGPIFIPGNVMLGWAKSIDGEYQWRTTSPIDGHSYGTGSMWLWEDCVAREAVFRRLFREPVPGAPGLMDFIGLPPDGPPPWDVEDPPTGVSDSIPPVTEILHGSPQRIVNGVVYVTSGTDLIPISSDNHYPGAEIVTWLRIYPAGTLDGDKPDFHLAGTEPDQGLVPFRILGPDFEWTLEFFSVDDRGLCNAEPPRTLGYRLDNTAPEITIADPIAGSVIGADTTITFDFSADDGGGSGVEVLQATFGGLVVEPGTRIPTLGFVPGSYILSVTAIDSLGNANWDNSTEVTIESLPPETVPITEPLPEPDPVIPIDPGSVTVPGDTGGLDIGPDIGTETDINLDTVIVPLASTETDGNGGLVPILIILAIALIGAVAWGSVVLRKRGQS